MKKPREFMEEVNDLFTLYDTISRIPNRSWDPPRDGYHGCKDCVIQSHDIFVATFNVNGAKLRIKFVPCQNIRESYILDILEVNLNGKTYDSNKLKELCPWFTRHCLSDRHFWVSEALIQYYRQHFPNAAEVDTVQNSSDQRVLLKPVVSGNIDMEKIRQAVKTVKGT